MKLLLLSSIAGKRILLEIHLAIANAARHSYYCIASNDTKIDKFVNQIEASVHKVGFRRIFITNVPPFNYKNIE